ncbi:MAG: hypothetical protein O9322_04085 [Beijerinckiaceae bacterium]|nr:hypothetical protein [Beijerinckiaceae bacterium]MCZ8298698.1 hypothetical protein [Beijerinckiaceae bacterium]
MRLAHALALLPLLAVPGMAAEPEKIVRSVLPGETVRVYIAYHVERDCTRSGEIRLAMIEPPAQGRLFLKETTTRGGFSYNNPRYACNQREIPAVEVVYEASGKADGLQRARYGLVFGDGQMRLIDAEITVWAPPAEPKAE